MVEPKCEQVLRKGFELCKIKVSITVAKKLANLGSHFPQEFASIDRFDK